MRPVRNVILSSLLALAVAAGVAKASAQDSAAPKAAAQGTPAIDFNRARDLFQKRQQGGTLTPEEEAYVQAAMQARKGGGGQKGAGQKGAGQKGGGQAGAGQDAAASLPRPKPTESTGMIPLTDMGKAKYKGEDGGLYGGGSNEPPASQAAAARKATAQIQPLDANGEPSKDGKIVFLSVGFSNVTMEFCAFKDMADKDPKKNPNLAIVDGAIGAQDAIIWADTENQIKNPTRKTATPARDVWGEDLKRLKTAGVTPAQVQVVWMKQARGLAGLLGEFPTHARELQANIEKIVERLKSTYPNLRVVYMSSRTYGGWATVPTNPEPYAYEGAFSVRWAIQDQINGKAELNDDPAKGPVKAPVLLWGPYLWTDGLKGRKDGLVWKLEDTVYKNMTIPLPNKNLPMQRDGTHPSIDGIHKVDDLLMKFFKTDPNAKTWFVGKSK
jgi:hypothetical protein